MLRFCLILLFPFYSLAQDSIQHEWSIGFVPKTGFLAAHRGTMGHLPKDRIFCGEMRFTKRLFGTELWHDTYRNPMVGLALYGSNLGNKEYLGYGYGAYPFIEFPMIRNTRSYLSWKMGCGLGYVTKVFDQELNPKNDGISTHVNALICIGINGHWRVAEHYSLIYGFDLTHFSNGSTRMPNLGLNIPTLSLGMAYHWDDDKKMKVQQQEFNRTPFFKNWYLTTVGIISTKQAFPTGGKNYPVIANNTFFWKQFRPKIGMEIGLDFISKQSLFKYRDYIPKTQMSIFQIGGYSTCILPLNHLKFILGMGCYIKDRYDSDNEFYHRVGMRYQLDNGLLINLVLKTHWAKADYVEYGIGYTFNYKKK